MSESTTTVSTTETTTKTSKFKHQNFLTKVGQSEFLLNALKGETPETLADFGITAEAVTTFENSIGQVIATDKVQEETKAKLKGLTAQLVGEQDIMEGMYATFKRKIKAEAPQEDWKKYGFADKQ